ncbi:hypothetical protein ABT160_08005 [Streptomyces sp. NPDC001941]|uniref:hypothetical protein n=1 Tax=Streptomyces sp. NPDC001941 TaxID=3154659 RepID=UPI0033200A47
MRHAQYRVHHVGIYRWFAVVGLVLVGASGVVNAVAVDGPAPQPYLRTHLTELQVIHEDPDGTCVVRYWEYVSEKERVVPFRCDPDRGSTLKAPNDLDAPDQGVEYGSMIDEGPHEGDLLVVDARGEHVAESDEDPRGDTGGDDVDTTYEVVGFLGFFGLLSLAVGVLCGGARSARRLKGISPLLVRRARRLRQDAAAVAQDHRAAVRAVREAWEPLHQELLAAELAARPLSKLRGTGLNRGHFAVLADHGVRTVRDALDAEVWGVAAVPGMGLERAEKVVAAARRTAAGLDRDSALPLDPDRQDAETTALFNALRVLVEARATAEPTIREGRSLAAGLDALLCEAAPATGVRPMLRADPRERRRAREAVSGLRELIARAGADGVRARLAQASVDLLRGPDADPAGIAARIDYASRPTEYRRALREATSGSARVRADR